MEREKKLLWWFRTILGFALYQLSVCPATDALALPEIVAVVNQENGKDCLTGFFGRVRPIGLLVVLKT